MGWPIWVSADWKCRDNTRLNIPTYAGRLVEVDGFLHACMVRWWWGLYQAWMVGWFGWLGASMHAGAVLLCWVDFALRGCQKRCLNWGLAHTYGLNHTRWISSSHGVSDFEWLSDICMVTSVLEGGWEVELNPYPLLINNAYILELCGSGVMHLLHNPQGTCPSFYEGRWHYRSWATLKYPTLLMCVCLCVFWNMEDTLCMRITSCVVFTFVVARPNSNILYK